jgi:GT2 family glycosyltransferase
METSVAVAIVNYNTREHLRACLQTVQLESPSEVVVVDNASSDGSVEMVRAGYPLIVLLTNKTNLGFGAAANQAIANCTAKYVLLLNSDILLRPGALKALGTYLDQHPRAAIVGPRLVNTDGTPQVSCYKFPTLLNTLLFARAKTEFRLMRYVPILRNRYLRIFPPTDAQVVPWVKGAALGIRREAFEAVEGFDESFFMYFEEADLCHRLNAAGWQIHFAPVTMLVHTGEASTKQWRADMIAQLFSSTLQFYQRHYPGLLYFELLVIMKGTIAFRLMVDTARHYFVKNAIKRVRIAEDVKIWQRVLHGLCEARGLAGDQPSGNA